MPVIKTIDRFVQLKKTLDELKAKHVEVGIMGDEAQESHEGSGLTNAELASIHENGTSTIPARPFITRAVNEKQAEYAQALNKLITKSIEKGTDPTKALEQLGFKAEADIKAFVKAGKATPALASSTIKQKGSSTPLIDSGQLLGSITSRVVDGRED